MKQMMDNVQGMFAKKGGATATDDSSPKAPDVTREQLAELSKTELIEYCMTQTLPARLQKEVEEAPQEPEQPPEDPLYHPSQVAKQIEAIAKSEVGAWNNPGAKLRLRTADGEEALPSDVARLLTNALQVNTSLSICGLHRMGLDDDTLATVFVPGVTKLTAVRFLVLYSNAITDEGVARLVETVKAGACPALEVLGLNNNKVELAAGGPQNALVTAIAAGNFPKLRQLYLMGNPISDAGKNAILAACANQGVAVYLPTPQWTKTNPEAMLAAKAQAPAEKSSYEIS